jgi:hypothetical protein
MEDSSAELISMPFLMLHLASCDPLLWNHKRVRNPLALSLYLTQIPVAHFLQSPSHMVFAPLVFWPATHFMIKIRPFLVEDRTFFSHCSDLPPLPLNSYQSIDIIEIIGKCLPKQKISLLLALAVQNTINSKVS